MKIPVFHDDQQARPSLVGAAMLNALKVAGKATSRGPSWWPPAPARRRWPAWACWSSWGMPRENIWVTDLAGVVYEGRVGTDGPRQGRFRPEDEACTLGEAIEGADIFPACRPAACWKPEMVRDGWPPSPSFARLNPTPEIMPDEVKSVRDDAIMATGRTDYPNQVNNVLCFPYIFRGALDCGATTITDEMEIAAVHAIAELAQAEQSEVVAAAYAGATLSFGPGVPDPQALRPAADDERSPRRWPQGGGRLGRGAAADSLDYDAYREKLHTSSTPPARR